MRFLLSAFAVLASVSVASAACTGDKTPPPDANAGIPLTGLAAGTPSQNALPLFWTLDFQTGDMTQFQNGGLGGLEGADHFCNFEATDGLGATTILKQAARAGLYKAILSNRHTDAIDRFEMIRGDSPFAPPGATTHDVMDSLGNCIAAGVDELFVGGYNLAYSLPDNQGVIAGKNEKVELWTASDQAGLRWKTETGTENAQDNIVLNNAYCSASSDPEDKGWSSLEGSSNIGVVNEDLHDVAGQWLSTGASIGCVNGIHLLCLQGAPTPTQPGGNGDPQFTGLQGQQFQVHGMPDEYFNLISSPDMQLNSRFTYLASGRCNYNNTECWTHPGTYIDQLGFMFPGLTIKAIAGTHDEGITVYVNEKRLSTNIQSTHHTIHSLKHHHDINSTQIITVTYKQHDQLIVAAPLFTITATNSDMFFNFGVSLHSPSLLSSGSALHHINDKSASSVYPTFPLHGLLGQTWKNARYQHGRMFAGTVDDYMLLDSKLISTKFIYNQYKH